MKILYFGDASWGAQALEEIVMRGHQVLGVVQRAHPTDGELAQVAEKLGFPLFQPQRCNDPDFLEIVSKLNPDLNLSVSYDQILRRPILESAPMGFVNFHAGKLPLYRGRSVLNWAIINGETEIGLTAHFVDEGIDTGDIILQRTLPIEWTDTYADVLGRTVKAFVPLVADTVDLLASNNYTRTSQKHLPGTYYPRRGPGDEWLDWTDSSFNLYNKIRALSVPGPGARSFLGNREIIVWRARYEKSWPTYIANPGQVVGVEQDGVHIKTGDSTIVLTEVEYLDQPGACSPQLPIGTRLGVNLQARLIELEKQLKK